MKKSAVLKFMKCYRIKQVSMMRKWLYARLTLFLSSFNKQFFFWFKS